MSDLPRGEAVAAAGWNDLVDELDRWEAAGRVAVLWWRDDDAAAPSPRLDRLLRLAAGLPLALAVIPALARAELAAVLAAAPAVAVLQHGWQHKNQAPAGAKKSEYPQGRSATVVEAEIGAGRARLRALFGTRALPVFVPPWNRFAAELLPIPARQCMAVSTMMDHKAPPLPPGLAALDADIDLVAWRGGGGFIGDAAALGRLIGCLRDRRCGVAAGPVGILTHHRIMDGLAADFLERLTALAVASPAVRWAGVGELLPGLTQ